MICEACRDRRHGECRGGSWCDCQHKPPAGDRGPDTALASPARTEVRTEAHTPRTDGRNQPAEPDTEDGTEPAINWLRQG